MKLSEFYTKVDSSVALAKIIFNYLLTKYDSKKISDFAKTTSGGTPRRGVSAYYGGDIPWIKSGELNDGLIIESRETITEDALKNSSAKLYPKGTLVLALYGATVGKVGILNFESASNQAVCALYPNKELDNKFLFWFLRQQRLDFINLSFGGAQPNISQTVVKKTKVPIPPIEIQRKVVKLLDEYENDKKLNHDGILKEIRDKLDKYAISKQSYDLLISNNTNNNIYISRLRQAILSEAIQGKLVPQDPNDEPASVLLEKIKAEKDKLIKEKKIRKEKPLPKIKEEEIPFELPKGWKWVKLQDVFDVRDGTHDTPKYVSKGIPLVTSKNLYSGKLDLNNVKYISEEDHFEISNRSKVEKRDLLFGMIGSIGNPAIVNIEPIFSIKNVALFKYYNIALSNPTYLYYFLLLAQNDMNNKSSGAVQSFVSLTYLRNYLFPLPPLAEQKRIVEKVDQLMKLCDELESHVKENQKNSKSLMNAVLREAFEV